MHLIYYQNVFRLFLSFEYFFKLISNWKEVNSYLPWQEQQCWNKNCENVMKLFAFFLHWLGRSGDVTGKDNRSIVSYLLWRAEANLFPWCQRDIWALIKQCCECSNNIDDCKHLLINDWKGRKKENARNDCTNGRLHRSTTKQQRTKRKENPFEIVSTFNKCNVVAFHLMTTIERTHARAFMRKTDKKLQ